MLSHNPKCWSGTWIWTLLIFQKRQLGWPSWTAAWSDTWCKGGSRLRGSVPESGWSIPDSRPGQWPRGPRRCRRGPSRLPGERQNCLRAQTLLVQFNTKITLLAEVGEKKVFFAQITRSRAIRDTFYKFSHNFRSNHFWPILRAL